MGKVSLSTFFLCQLSPILLCLLFATAFYSSSVFFLVPLFSSNPFNKSASLAFSSLPLSVKCSQNLTESCC